MIEQELYDYVMNSPYNTNPAILRQKIKEVAESGSGGTNVVIVSQGENEGEYVCSHTIEQIGAMFESGSVPIVYYFMKREQGYGMVLDSYNLMDTVEFTSESDDTGSYFFAWFQGYLRPTSNEIEISYMPDGTLEVTIN